MRGWRLLVFRSRAVKFLQGHDDGERPVLGVFERPPRIRADDAQPERIEAAKKNHGQRRGGITGNGDVAQNLCQQYCDAQQHGGNDTDQAEQSQ